MIKEVQMHGLKQGGDERWSTLQKSAKTLRNKQIDLSFDSFRHPIPLQTLISPEYWILDPNIRGYQWKMLEERYLNPAID